MTNRHADSDTIDHIIDLRRRLAEAERQRDNALTFVSKMRKLDVKEIQRLAEIVYWNAETSRIRKVGSLILEVLKNEDRDC